MNNHQELETSIIIQLDQIEKGVLLILKTADENTLHKKPKSSKWSAAEHIAHIEIVNRLYIDKIKDALDTSSSPGKIFTSTIFGKWFTKLMEPPVGVRLKTFNPMKPQKVLDTEQLRKKFVDTNKQLLDLFNRAVYENKLNMKITSPVTNLVKFKIGDAFSVITAHARRHIWLIEEILNEG